MASPEPSAEQISRVFKAGSEPVRVRILALLSHGELCVCHLHALLDLPQSTVSRHLAVLRAADLVHARRDGPWVHYRLTATAERWFAPALEGWRRDEGLRRRCCEQKDCG
ncbi:metalloregulator ArsR/SmtB family transcription factor [Myxococcota bacterium]|nr:metalloregulator ArsR/SmtB family transcription factor [Myxococcota bacterium]